MGHGMWLSAHCPAMSERDRSRITEKIKYCVGVFKKWDTIVHNLNNSAITDVDARDFTLKKFYFAAKLSWCFKEQDQNKKPATVAPTTPPTQAYDEQKFQGMVNYIRNSNILNDVSFNPDQADLIADRLKKALQDICEAARNN